LIRQKKSAGIRFLRERVKNADAKLRVIGDITRSFNLYNLFFADLDSVLKAA